MTDAARMNPCRLYAALAAVALGAASLAGCGHGDKTGAGGAADNVEGPAEEALSALPASAAPQADPNANATTAATDAATAADNEDSPAAPAISAASAAASH